MTFGDYLRFAALVLTGLLVFSPIAYLGLSAFKDVAELWRDPPTFLPQRPTLSGFKTILDRGNFGRYFLNSVVVATASSMLVVASSTMTGYVFAKFRFRFQNALFALLLAGMMIPGQVTVIQNYITLRWLGGINTYWGLVLPQGVSIFSIFFMRQYFHSVHDDFMDAGRIDGLSELGVLLRVMLPLATTGAATVAILAFRGSWDNLLWPLILTTRSHMRTLPVGIAGLATVHSPLIELLLPASVLAVVPVVIVFAVFQRQVVESVAASGIKS